MDFFQTLNSRPINVALGLHQKCCRVMHYKYLPKGSIVFEKGNASDRLYIILTGAVNVFSVKTKEQIRKEYEWMQRMSNKVKETHDNEDEEIARRVGVFLDNEEKDVVRRTANSRVKTPPKEYNVMAARKNLFQVREYDDSSMSEQEESLPQFPESSSDEDEKADEDEDDSDDDEEEEDPSALQTKLFGNIKPECVQNLDSFFTNGIFHLIFETTLKAGLMFGELGLMKSKPRQRTIICQEDCEFATIEKTDFLDIMKQVKERKRRDKIAFVENSLFPELGFVANKRAAEVMKKMYVSSGQKIYQEKDNPDHVYIIREGEVTVK